jgi:serine/threonine-protein kinase RsbW
MPPGGSHAPARTLRRSWPAFPKAVAAARNAVAEYARAAGVSPAAHAAIKLAVSEAVTNTVLHAYRDRESPGPVVVTAQLGEDSILVVVSDEGVGMAPRTDSPGSGLGLPLIAQMTEAFEVEHGRMGGTRVEMRFAL